MFFLRHVNVIELSLQSRPWILLTLKDNSDKTVKFPWQQYAKLITNGKPWWELSCSCVEPSWLIINCTATTEEGTNNSDTAFIFFLTVFVFSLTLLCFKKKKLHRFPLKWDEDSVKTLFNAWFISKTNPLEAAAGVKMVFGKNSRGVTYISSKILWFLSPSGK